MDLVLLSTTCLKYPYAVPLWKEAEKMLSKEDNFCRINMEFWIEFRSTV